MSYGLWIKAITTSDKIKGDKMSCNKDYSVENERFTTTLRSYKEYLQSTVEIGCKDFETFSKIVVAVQKILDEEIKTD